MSASTPQASRPLARRIQARTFRVINVPMRILLGLPFPTPAGRRLMLLYLTGRKTGRRYRQPVSYIGDGDTLLTPGAAAGSSTSPRDTPCGSDCAAKTSRPCPKSSPIQARYSGCLS